MVEVTADVEDISHKDDSFFQQFDLVVATNCSADQLVTNQFCYCVSEIPRCFHSADLVLHFSEWEAF